MRRAVLALSLLLPAAIFAQDRLAHMPRFDRYDKLRSEIAGSVSRGDLNIRWAADSKSFSYFKSGKSIRYSLATGREAEDKGGVPEAAVAPTGRRNRGRQGPERGRQFATALSGDGKLKAECRNRDVFISDTD